MRRLTLTTTISGSTAQTMGGWSRWAPVMHLGGVELARGGGALAHELDRPPPRRLPSAGRRHSPRPALRAAASARCSHHMPKASMMTEAMMPRPGAANGVVPKNGIGIAF